MHSTANVGEPVGPEDTHRTKTHFAQSLTAARDVKDHTNAPLTHTSRMFIPPGPSEKTEGVPAAGRTRLTAATDDVGLRTDHGLGVGQSL